MEHRYAYVVPSAPEVGAGSTYVASDHPYGDPIGVAVNGVPFFADHGAAPTVFEFDACGGHVDRAHRHHYHGPPLCLLRSLGALGNATRPTLGAAAWAASGAPSPRVGVMLDGFPLFGPYDASGALRTSATLGPCNFDVATRRYHVSPDPPYAPVCLRGSAIGSVAASMTAARCPLRGLESAYCEGACALDPPAPCPGGGTAAALPAVYAALFVACLLGALWGSRGAIKRSFDDFKARRLRGARPPPWATAALSSLGSLVLLACAPRLMRTIYRNNGAKADAYQNDAAASYLSVAGLVYGLVLAQTLSVASERLAAIQAHLAAECAGLHRTFLLIAALSAATHTQLSLKTELLDILFVYAEHLLEEITVGRCADVKQLAKLYSIVPALEKASANCGEFHNDIAKSSLEAAGETATSRYARSALERRALHWSLYALNLLLCNGMFFGILLIQSGSEGLNAALCFATVALIAASSYLIADLDAPHEGLFVVDLEDACKLYDQIVELKSPSRLAQGLQDELVSCRQLARAMSRESDGELTPHVTGGRLRAKVLAVASLRGSGHAGNGVGVPPRVHPSDADAKPGASLLNP